MRKHLFYWLWALCPILSFSQDIPGIDWSEVYGGSAQDLFADIQPTDDGGYIMIGSTNSFELIDNPNNENNYDVWVIKTNSEGEVEWEKTYGGTNSEGAIAIRKISDGYVFAANTHSDDGDVPDNYGDVNNNNTARDIWVVKIDFNGSIIWSKNFGGPLFDTVFSLEITPDEGFVLGGVIPFSYFPEYSFSGYAGYILKLDASGNIEWQKPYGGSLKSEISYVKPLIDGGYVFLGISKSADGDLPANYGSDDVWVGKIDNEGNLLWSKNFGGSSSDYVPHGSGIELTNDNGFLICTTVTSYDGNITESLDLFPGIGDIWVIKLNHLGELVWEKSFGGEAPDGAYEIRKTVQDNEYIIVGYTFPTFDDLINNDSNLLVTKIDNQGNTIWSKDFGGSYLDAYSLTGIDVITNSRILVDNNTNQYTLTCTTTSNDGDVPPTNLGFDNIWLFKLEPDCNIPLIENTISDIICEGETAQISVTTEGQTVNWYDTVDGETPVFTGVEFITPELTETTSYWVEVANWGCISERSEVIVTVNPLPEVNIENTEVEVCSGNEASLYAFSEGNVIFWYANEDDTEYLYHGNNFITEPLTENTSYWVEGYNLITECKSDRIEITVIVNEFADLTLENTEAEICEGGTVSFTATSGSSINWYDTEDGTTPIFTGAEFNTPELFESTSYWVEASGSGECVSERIEVTITVNPAPPAPLAYEIQDFEEGETLADLEVEAEGELTWYADEALTIELPETTPLVDDTTYWVTQTINGCESEATDITVDDDTLGTGNVNETDFTYYPNPVKNKLYFKGTEKVQTVQVYDMSGSLLINQQNKANGTQEVDVTSLSKGAYIVKAHTEKEVKTFKIIKN